jgi:hypothetical protein
MNAQQITFCMAGLLAGLICVAIASTGSPETRIISLTWFVGPFFFVAVLAGSIITGAWRYFQPGLLRYLTGLVLCTITYALALIAFFAVFGFSPDWLGFQPSASIALFGVDVALGLIAAAVVGAVGISLFAALLTGTWSNHLLQRLMLAGLLAVSATFIANFPFQRNWSFFGVLLPVGNALFCYFVGSHIWYHDKSRRHA